jgi:histidinol phosphatase-like PHP family hydrolase
MHFGIKTAGRGRLTKEDVVNTLPLKKFLEILKKEKDRRF